MTFVLVGDFSRIRALPPDSARNRDPLWRHTCFEAFVAMDRQPCYYEFNFAPSGKWAAYTLRGYRDGEPLADRSVRPLIAVRSTDHRLELHATIRLGSLSTSLDRAALRLGLSAVIETADGLTYWALRHPARLPDFHDARGFALRLRPPGAVPSP